ncbi:hypothetical protein BDW59DRAFT_135408 [Aspergillus cavernicola]|uniref:Polynucleotide adenylyltransferase n=1 Tax=Aspergillus cavernicola TaxID=176166 RepID=A0ABR4HMW2_9EURO
MRLCIRLRLPLNRLLHSPTDCCRRSFHHGHPPAKDPTIFEDSLEKTLEVHRSANRQSLIRKVVSRSDLRVPIPPFTPLRKPAESKSQPSVPKLRKRVNNTNSPRRILPEDTRVPIHQPVGWRVRNGKPQQCPWLNEMGPHHTFSGGISQLDAEACALDRYLIPTTQEEKVVGETVSGFTKALQDLTQHPLHVVRSRRTGFAMSHSDINFVLLVPDPVRSNRIRMPSANRPWNQRRYSNIQWRIWRKLPLSPSYKLQISNTPHSAPRIIHQPTGLQLQFNCADGLPASDEYIQDFQAEYPYLRPLYMAARLILEVRGLFGDTNASLSPIALQLLIAAFLKMNHGRFSRDSGCGEPLLAFLRTFGSEIDLTTTGIAVDPPAFFNAESVKEACTIYKHDGLPAHLRGQRALINAKKSAALHGNESLAHRLCLQHPANYMTDLGGRCTRTAELQSAFADAYSCLKSALDVWEPVEPGSLSKNTSVLGTALRANFEDFESRRAAIVKFDGWRRPSEGLGQ